MGPLRGGGRMLEVASHSGPALRLARRLERVMSVTERRRAFVLTV